MKKIGDKICRLTIIGEDKPHELPSGKRLRKFFCRCDCGNLKSVISGNIKEGKTESCGCLQKERARATKTLFKKTHGMTQTSEYAAWHAMVQRCSVKTNQSYSNYGGRGIKVCDRWLGNFNNFLLDMGKKPTPAHSLDRIDNNGNYEPSNCRWATKVEQGNNRRDNKTVTYDGVTRTLAMWSRIYFGNSYTVSRRLKSGWSVERTLNTPIKGS